MTSKMVLPRVSIFSIFQAVWSGVASYWPWSQVNVFKAMGLATTVRHWIASRKDKKALRMATRTEHSGKNQDVSPLPDSDQPPHLKVLSIYCDKLEAESPVIKAMSLLGSEFYSAYPTLYPESFFPNQEFQIFVGQGYAGRLLAFLYGVLGLSVDEVIAILSFISKVSRAHPDFMQRVVNGVLRLWRSEERRKPQPTMLYWDDGFVDNADTIFQQDPSQSDDEAVATFLRSLFFDTATVDRPGKSEKVHTLVAKVGHWNALRGVERRFRGYGKNIALLVSLGGEHGFENADLVGMELEAVDGLVWYYFPLEKGWDESTGLYVLSTSTKAYIEVKNYGQNSEACMNAGLSSTIYKYRRKLIHCIKRKANKDETENNPKQTQTRSLADLKMQAKKAVPPGSKDTHDKSVDLVAISTPPVSPSPFATLSQLVLSLFPLMTCSSGWVLKYHAQLAHIQVEHFWHMYHGR
ncbi:hypothetical protein BJ508DRAFT_381320 [Ascobolus immersus RN42]|uniref:Uncharacterized protein n=1 Tax=Ascobolus immersus RN42 TaxID=1160509 RepID=A0A3N4HFE4_ASCIM|nr:hypothetical protein BJ508DRAFT_381320 [Ascobolus immersus RN42]